MLPFDGHIVHSGDAFHFLELCFTHFMGSDSHNPRPSHHWFSDAIKAVAERAGSGVAHSLVNDNPHAVLNDHDLSYLPQPVDPVEKERSFKVKIPRLFKR